MNYWLIKPRDPIVMRDGRPFGNTPGARARTLDFPLPQTLAGAYRTKYWLDKGKGFSATKPTEEEKTELEELKKEAIIGPILAEVEQAQIKNVLFAYPADSLPLKDDSGNIEIKRLLPLDIGSDSLSNLPADLYLIGLANIDEAKKPEALAKYWYWSEYLKWLKGETVDKGNLGHDGPSKEYRSHVALNDDHLTAEEGELFQTSALEFVRNVKGAKKDLGLLIAANSNSENKDNNSISGNVDKTKTYAYLGGEKRMVAWQNSTWQSPSLPIEILDKIKADKACRIILLTPAIFESGYKPGPSSKIFKDSNGLKVELKAIAIARHQTISGWDYAQRAPKKSRRIALAGTVFFIKLAGDESAIEAWAKSIWWSNISDDAQDQKDGYGLAVLATWTGNLEKLEVK